MEKEKGLSLYLALVVMSILLAIILGMSAILVSQLKVIRKIESSVIAFYAAETGIERVLTYRAGDPAVDFTECSDEDNACSVGEAEYYVQILRGNEGDCPIIKSYCIQSVGSYSNVKRAIQVSY